MLFAFVLATAFIVVVAGSASAATAPTAFDTCWSTTADGMSMAPSITMSPLGKMGRGVVAISDIAEGTVLMHIPRGHVMSGKTRLDVVSEMMRSLKSEGQPIHSAFPWPSYLAALPHDFSTIPALLPEKDKNCLCRHFADFHRHLTEILAPLDSEMRRMYLVFHTRNYHDAGYGYSMVPCVDLINHNTRRQNVNVTFLPTHVAVVASTLISQGDEVFSSYGIRYPADAVRFGFLDETDIATFPSFMAFHSDLGRDCSTWDGHKDVMRGGSLVYDTDSGAPSPALVECLTRRAKATRSFPAETNDLLIKVFEDVLKEVEGYVPQFYHVPGDGCEDTSHPAVALASRAAVRTLEFLQKATLHAHRRINELQQREEL